MKILTIVGARPQFIKAAPVSRALRTNHTEILVHTGQHYDESMSAVFFQELDLPPLDYHLGVGSASHGAQTAAMLAKIEEVLLRENPDRVLIYGDTNSTIAGALAAVKLHIPLAHVGSGLRSFNRLMPEEINRVVADALSDCLFVPTRTAEQNLLKEGIDPGIIHLVGDVMYDAALHFADQAAIKSRIFSTLALERGGYILVTIHRPENSDNTARLTVIVRALEAIAREIRVILPLHPRTRQALARANLWDRSDSKIQFIDPVGYLDMVRLEQNAALIVTDSGGVQKEAFFYKIPCVTLRTETEWVELTEFGWNQVCPPTSVERVIECMRAAIGSKGLDISPYGDGNAALMICRVIEAIAPPSNKQASLRGDEHIAPRCSAQIEQ